MVPVAWVCAAFAYHNAILAKTVATIDRFINARQLFHNTQQNLCPNTDVRETMGKAARFYARSQENATRTAGA
jgi:hypothetical protein